MAISTCEDEGSTNNDEARIALIQAVVEDTIDKLDIVANLNPIQMDPLSSQDESISLSVINRKRLEQQYGKLMQKRQQLGQKLQGAKAIAEQREVREVTQALNSMDEMIKKKLERKHHGNETFLANIRREKNRALNVLQRTLNELSDTHSCPTLVGIVKEEKDKEIKHQSLVKENKMVLEEIAAFRIAIDEERHQKIVEKTKIDAQIKKLKHELTLLKNEINVKQVFLSNEQKAFLNAQRRTKLNEEILRQKQNKEFTLQLHKDKRAFELADNHLTRRTKEAEDTLELWRHRHEFDVQEQEQKVSFIEREHNEIVMSLRSTREKLQQETDSKNARIECRRLKRELMRKQQMSAIKIQAIFRGFCVRVQKLRRQEKDKKKGGKKNKKKGKKAGKKK